MTDLQVQNITVDKIMEIIPHRYPLLLVDRILEMHPDQGAVAIKNVTINEDFFNGHFPGKPIMPGVLIIEAMAQASAAFVVLSMGMSTENKLVYFMSIDGAHFRKPVIPGDTLYLHIQKIKSRGNVWKMKGEAKVDGQRVADAVFSAMVVNKNN
jgi:3-hydroxyacyl-[acyl-carrier-protein] dehydratase